MSTENSGGLAPIPVMIVKMRRSVTSIETDANAKQGFGEFYVSFQAFKIVFIDKHRRASLCELDIWTRLFLEV